MRWEASKISDNSTKDFIAKV